MTLSAIDFAGDAISAIFDWLQAWAGWLALASLLMFLVSLWIVSCLIIRLPEDYFVDHRVHFRDAHPTLRVVLVMLSTLIGAILVAAGIAMLITPGQGVITILVGLSLMSFPGKHALIEWILARQSIRRAINWIRRKAHRPPLIFKIVYAPTDLKPGNSDSPATETQQHKEQK